METVPEFQDGLRANEEALDKIIHTVEGYLAKQRPQPTDDASKSTTQLGI